MSDKTPLNDAYNTLKLVFVQELIINNQILLLMRYDVKQANNVILRHVAE